MSIPASWKSRLFLVLLLSLSAAGPAAAANGTLSLTFAYLDPVTGVERLLDGGYVYLHIGSKQPPMEKFYSKADYIYGPTLTNGTLSVSVPEGSYYVRIVRRQGSTTGYTMYGPPNEGDYSWMQPTAITIAAGQTLSLGKRFAVPYKLSPITISGTVTTAAGDPLQGRYVRAQTEPCLVPVNCTDAGCEQYGNQCGATKFLALRTTDAGGTYTLMLADPGTYYLYTSSCLMPGHNGNDTTRCQYWAAPSPVTVKRGDSITVNIVAQ